jgi:ATP-binding cassette subfamily B protein
VFRQRYGATRADIRRQHRRFAARRSTGDLFAQSSLIIAVFGTYAFIAYRTVHGAITIGDLVMYFQAFQRGHEFLRELLGGLAGLYEDRLFLSNIYEFLDLERNVVEPRAPKAVPRPLRIGIAFENVSFRYPGTSRTVLHDITFSIEPGETVALVGDNGSGKTTLIKLLCRLYDPTSGAIRLDGIDIRELGTASLRRELGVLFQDYARYQLSARENIWLGDVDASPRDDRVVQAARRSGADAVIGGLTHGYDTTLGTWFEHAQELSIGEWQKVALARAFMREAQIVVLDEPTSALDAKAEYEVFERFRRLTHGRTAILISHRLSTVKMADRIFVLGNGRIVESGTHDELVRNGGRYEQLFELQAQPYR